MSHGHYHSCTNCSNLEMEPRYMTKSVNQLNPNILRTKNENLGLLATVFKLSSKNMSHGHLRQVTTQFSMVHVFGEWFLQYQASELAKIGSKFILISFYLLTTHILNLPAIRIKMMLNSRPTHSIYTPNVKNANLSKNYVFKLYKISVGNLINFSFFQTST